MTRQFKGAGSLIAGPIITVVAVLALWGNEGRFDYARAAKNTVETRAVGTASPQAAVSYTAKLQDCRLDGVYVARHEGYYRVVVSAEIYSWKMTENDRGKEEWSKRWNTSLENNARNASFTQVLKSQSHELPSYQLGELVVDSASLHFADSFEDIDPRNVRLSDLGRSLGLTAEGSYLYLRKPGSVDRLGDERLRLRGIRTRDTATYFGSIVDGRGVGKQYEYARGMISSLIQNDGMLHHLVNGTRPEALKTVRADFRKLVWFIRLAGSGAVIVGLLLFFSKLLHLIMIVPIIGNLASLGVWLISLTLGLFISLGTILSSMLFHNPWVALGAMAGVLAMAIVALAARNATRSNARQQLRSYAGNPGSPTRRTEPSSRTPGQTDGEEVKRKYRNLVRLAMIDGTLEESENNYLVEWGRSNGLSDGEITELFDQSKRDGDSDLEVTQFEDLHALISLAMIDGFLSSQELSHIIRFGEQLGMNRAQVNAVITKVRTGEFSRLVTA